MRLRSNRQGAPASLIVSRSVPTSSAAVRAPGVGFAATENEMFASPWPFCPPDSDTQLVSEATDHVQSRVVDTAIVPVPPAAGKEDGDVVAETAHLLEEGATTEVVVEPQRLNSRAALSKTSAAAPTFGRAIVRSGTMHVARQFPPQFFHD